MREIEFLYARNIVARRRGVPQQELSFAWLVRNLAYQKNVEVHWVGEDGVWQMLPATYLAPAGQEYEIWQASISVAASEEVSLPGNVVFAVTCTMQGQRYHDDNGGEHYAIDADAGMVARADRQVLNVEYSPRLEPEQKTLRITVLVQRTAAPQRVFVRWSRDNWQTFQETACTFQRTYWDRQHQSNARNPNRYGWEVWKAQIRVDETFQLDYVVGCDTASGQMWDNNDGRNYTCHRGLFKVLTLNLHCYQEENQDAKLNAIVQAIRDLDVDVVCLQEVAENWNNGHGDWNSNAAKVLRDRLGEDYFLHTDWAHIGFDRYREGVAILSKHPFLLRDAGYVSRSHDVYDIHARKAVMVQIEVPYFGRINVFAVHLSWWHDGFAHQFTTLRSWANHKHADGVVATLLCGDFNAAAGGEGYRQVVATREFEDQFLEATAPQLFAQVFRDAASGWPERLANDGRIDFIFKKTGSRLRVADGRVLFTDEVYGRVSDHFGYYVAFAAS